MGYFSCLNKECRFLSIHLCFERYLTGLHHSLTGIFNNVMNVISWSEQQDLWLGGVEHTKHRLLLSCDLLLEILFKTWYVFLCLIVLWKYVILDAFIFFNYFPLDYISSLFLLLHRISKIQIYHLFPALKKPPYYWTPGFLVISKYRKQKHLVVLLLLVLFSVLFLIYYIVVSS